MVVQDKGVRARARGRGVQREKNLIDSRDQIYYSVKIYTKKILGARRCIARALRRPRQGVRAGVRSSSGSDVVKNSMGPTTAARARAKGGTTTGCGSICASSTHRPGGGAAAARRACARGRPPLSGRTLGCDCNGAQRSAVWRSARGRGTGQVRDARKDPSQGRAAAAVEGKGDGRHDHRLRLLRLRLTCVRRSAGAARSPL